MFRSATQIRVIGEGRVTLGSRVTWTFCEIHPGEFERVRRNIKECVWGGVGVRTSSHRWEQWDSYFTDTLSPLFPLNIGENWRLFELYMK